MMERVAILGADSLVAKHLLLSALSPHHKNTPLKAVSLWKLHDEFTPGQQAVLRETFGDGVALAFNNGLSSLGDAIDGCDTIFNLHEVHDFSVVPDKKALKVHNVEFVGKLLKLCEFSASAVRLVHASSVYLQVSSRWPNVCGRESADYFVQHRSECPFPAYCESKYEAEQLIRSASASSQGGVRSVCARLGPLYGEGDRCSLVCDSILLSKLHSQIPLVGDQSGFIQMTYAGNAAHALLKCAEKMASDPSVRSELVLIGDGTPIHNFYDLIVKPLFEDDGAGDSAFQPKINQRRIPFYVFYSLYCLVSLVGFLLGKILRVKSALSKLPAPSYPYLVFHQWTSFSDFKLRIFFDFKPPFDYATSLQRSMDYYRKLKPDRIDKHSWMPLLDG